MHQPCDSDKSVRSESRINHRGGQQRIGQLPYSESSVQIGSAGPSNENCIECSASWLRNTCHDDHETQGADRGSVIVGGHKWMRNRHEARSFLLNRSKCELMHPVAKRTMFAGFEPTGRSGASSWILRNTGP